MSQLAKHLSSYYTRKNNRIIFNDSLTLNALAIEMYERLNYSQIDSSVISRVLKGERLFTVQQLQIFCEVLRLPKTKQTKLFEALQEDHLFKKGYPQQEIAGTSFTDKLDMIETLLTEAFSTYYEGRSISAGNFLKIIDTYLKQCPLEKLSATQKKKWYDLNGTRLYLQGRLMACLSLSDNVLPQTLNVTNELFSLWRISRNSKLYAYANTLLSNAYYIAGGYSITQEKKRFYKKSIEYGKKTLPFFAGEDRNRLFALRNIIASTIYLRDELTFSGLKKTVEGMMPMQPLENRIPMLHMLGTIAKGEAYFRQADPLEIRAKGIHFFGKDLSGAGAFEISDIRMELETLLLLDSKEKKYVKSLVTKGILLSNYEQMVRYKNYFKKIETTL